MAAVAEVVLAAAAVVLDIGIPTLVILALMVASLVVRRQGLSSLGLRRVSRPWALAGKMLAVAAGWSVVNLALLKPVGNHLSGTTQDMSQFQDLRGSLAQLLLWLALGWSLAAFGEELAFRGFLLTRTTEVIGETRSGVVGAVVLTSVLMGVLHTEYGAVGVVVSAVDGVLYAVLRYRYRTLWASVLAHGFIDTIGFVTVFLVGPVSGFW